MSDTFLQRTVSKTQMAMVQLDAAITAYIQGRDIEAITLAGAAEEIFGAMCSRNGIENAVEKVANLPPMNQISKDQKKRIDYLNNVRNNLKHAKDKIEDNFVIAELDSFVMIVRALGNVAILGIDESETMLRFRNGGFMKNILESQ
jgi:cytochrome c oxidase assembly protein Cox11